MNNTQGIVGERNAFDSFELKEKTTTFVLK